MSASVTERTHHFVRHRTEAPDPKWYFGLDLGQRRDHSALAVLHLRWVPRGCCPATPRFIFTPELRIRSLTRFPIGTSYERLHELLEHRLAAVDAVTRLLVVDAAGPGAPIVDRLRQGLCHLRPVILTGGKSANALAGGYTAVPRRTLITTIRRLMASRSLRCKPGLPGWLQLKEELLALSAADTQPGDAGAHDDLAIATGLAAWAAAEDHPELKA